MGHKTNKIAMRYQHPSPGHKLKAVQSLDMIHEIRNIEGDNKSTLLIIN